MSRLPLRFRLALAAWSIALLVAGVQWSMTPEPVQVTEHDSKAEPIGQNAQGAAPTKARRGLELINLQLY